MHLTITVKIDDAPADIQAECAKVLQAMADRLKSPVEVDWSFLAPDGDRAKIERLMKKKAVKK